MLLSKCLLSLPPAGGFAIHSLMVVLAKWLLWSREHERKWWSCKSHDMIPPHCLPSATSGSDPNRDCSFHIPAWVGHGPGATLNVHMSKKAASSPQRSGVCLLMPHHLANTNLPPSARVQCLVHVVMHREYLKNISCYCQLTFVPFSPLAFWEQLPGCSFAHQKLE